MTDLEHRQLLQIVAGARGEDDMLDDLAEFAARVVKADSCDILFRDAQDGLVLRASSIVPELVNRLKLGRGVGLSGEALVASEAKYVSNKAFAHSSYAKYPGLSEKESCAVAAIPMRHVDGSTFGVMIFRRRTPWRFSAKEKEKLNDVAQLMALGYKSYRAGYQIGTQSNRLGALSEVSKTISTSPYIDEVLQLLVNLTAQQFNYRVCTVRLLDEERQELVLRATQATAKAYQRKRGIKLGESIAGRTLEENRPVIVRDVQVDSDYIGHDLAVEQGLRSMICIPLTIQDKPVGVLSCYTGEVRDFTSDEISALETLAQQAALAIEHAKLQVRDTLMQEVHHRVKNNLQQVAALLRLQLKTASYKTLEEALNDVLTRILAISAVHDLLSRDDLDHVGIRSIAESLVHHQQSSLILPNKNVSFLVRGDDFRLNMNQATQVALLMNELISNAVEHGFDTTNDGEIHITVETQENTVCLWVSNNGDQLPPDFDPTKTNSLGLQIVENLARAMNGTFKISDVLGWTVSEVKFPKVTGE
ncbi:MAG: GAF domain-containing protein [Armatimonadetes bacterium]|nr:GAF domain-containing protein [Armatimonadota bacterium]MBS1702389.1 GAF domain-containing protein [Armatimonadota bacterium]MBS1725817.1 GAF domain-containing protein [Armatimonadota bacterium]